MFAVFAFPPSTVIQRIVGTNAAWTSGTPGAELACLNDPQPLLRLQLLLKVGGVELGAFHESFPLRHSDYALMPVDESICPETLERSIDVNGGQ